MGSSGRSVPGRGTGSGDAVQVARLIRGADDRLRGAERGVEPRHHAGASEGDERLRRAPQPLHEHLPIGVEQATRHGDDHGNVARVERGSHQVGQEVVAHVHVEDVLRTVQGGADQLRGSWPRDTSGKQGEADRRRQRVRRIEVGDTAIGKGAVALLTQPTQRRGHGRHPVHRREIGRRGGEHRGDRGFQRRLVVALSRRGEEPSQMRPAGMLYRGDECGGAFRIPRRHRPHRGDAHEIELDRIGEPLNGRQRSTAEL